MAQSGKKDALPLEYGPSSQERWAEKAGVTLRFSPGLDYDLDAVYVYFWKGREQKV